MILPVVQFVTYLFLLTQAQNGILASSASTSNKDMKQGQLSKPLRERTIDRTKAGRRILLSGVVSTGFWVDETYADAACSGEEIIETGYQLGVCSKLSDFSSSQNSYTQNDDGTITLFTDSYDTGDCSGEISITLEQTYPSYECTDYHRVSYQGSETYNTKKGVVTKFYTDGVCQGDIDYYIWMDTSCAEMPCTNAVYTSFDAECLGGGSSDDEACFAGNEVLTLATGESKIISEVQVGDEVMVLNSDNEFVFSEVIFIPHVKNTIRATFYELMTSSGKTIKATEGHLVQAGMCGSVSALKYIEEINSADCVTTVDGEEQVVSAKSSQENGVYTVVTADANGKVVVNGIVASSFGTNHAVANSYYHFHRMLHGLGFDDMLAKLTTLLGSAVGKLV